MSWRIEKQELERQVKDLKKKLEDGEAKKPMLKQWRQASDDLPKVDDLKRQLNDVSAFSVYFSFYFFLGSFLYSVTDAFVR